MSDFLQRANELIGVPYDAENNHCYTLVMELLPRAPKIDFVAVNLFNSIKKIDAEIVELQLREVSIFENEDIILLGRDGIYHHVGVFYGDGIIHADSERGVVYDDFNQMKKLFSCVKGLRL